MSAVAVVAIVGGAYIVGGAPGLIDDRSEERGGRDVDLPEPSEVAGDADPSGPEGCVPEGCELWRIELDHDGWVWPGDGILIDTARLRGGLDGVGSGEWEDGVGSEAAGDGGPQAAPVRIRTYSSGTGDLLWERTVRVLEGTMYGLDGALDADGKVLLATPSGLVALDAEDGAERWVSDVSGGALVSWTSIDGDLVVATEAHPEPPSVDSGHGELPLEDGPLVDVSRIDGDTGAVLWQVERRTLLGFGPSELFVAGDGPGAVVTMALADGTVRWEGEWPQLGDGSWWPETANGRVLFMTERSAVVASLDTGDTILELDRDGGPGPAYLVGDLLVLGPPWEYGARQGATASAQASFVALDGDELRPEVVDGVVAVTPVHREVLPRYGPGRPEAEGLAVLFRTDSGYTLRLLALDAQPRWERQWEVEGDGCCWSLQPNLGAPSLVVTPDDASADPVRIVAIDDGRTEETVAVPAGLGQAFTVGWVGQVVIAQGDGPGLALVVSGPGGRFSAPGAGGFGLYGLEDGVLVVSLGRTFVGLDLDLLSGDP